MTPTQGRRGSPARVSPCLSDEQRRQPACSALNLVAWSSWRDGGRRAWCRRGARERRTTMREAKLTRQSTSAVRTHTSPNASMLTKSRGPAGHPDLTQHPKPAKLVLDVPLRDTLGKVACVGHTNAFSL